MKVVELCQIASTENPRDWPEFLLNHYIDNKDRDIFGKRNYIHIDVLKKNYSLLDSILTIFHDELKESNREARTKIKSGAIKINGEQVKDINYRLSEKDIINPSHKKKSIVFENGKYNFGLFHVLDKEDDKQIKEDFEFIKEFLKNPPFWYWLDCSNNFEI